MSFLNYIPAQLHCNKETYISYHVLNPQTNRLHRKKIKLNFIKSINERKKYARKLMHEINIKLASGWNPFLENEAPRSFTKLFDSMDIFLKNKNKELRPDSMRSYNSNIKILKDWITKKLKQPDIYVLNFNNLMANDYMSYIYNDKDLSERVFNNYKRFGVTFWNWLIENQYCKANPFKTIKLKREQEKKRIIIDFETRYKLKSFLLNNNELEYYAICLLTYSCLLRPKEITFLKKENFMFEKKMIVITPEISKTRKTRYVTMPENLIKILFSLGFEDLNKDYYMFSTKLKPGKNKIDGRIIAKRWAKLRTQINIPMEMQFYSLKDTGIVQMLRDGISPEIVRNQAGHSSLEMTNKYIPMATGEANKDISDKFSEF